MIDLTEQFWSYFLSGINWMNMVNTLFDDPLTNTHPGKQIFNTKWTIKTVIFVMT